MRERFWRLAARFIAARPAMVDALIRISQRTPYIHVYDAKGTLFMERWWLVTERSWLPFAIRIHHICRPDPERDLHDHPWNYRTIVLRGSYIERDQTDTHPRAAGTTVASPAGHFHTIESVSEGGVWTLFFTGRHAYAWGFLSGGRKIPWEAYLESKGFTVDKSDADRPQA